jgi:hypothetical protein
LDGADGETAGRFARFIHSFQSLSVGTVDTRELHDRKADPMSDQQIHGAALFLVGVAILIVSVSIAWTLSRSSRARRVEGA